MDYSGAGVPVTELSSIFRRRRSKIGTSIEQDAHKDVDKDVDDAGDDDKTVANDIAKDVRNNWPSKEQICSDAVDMAMKTSTLGDKASFHGHRASAYCDEFCTGTAADIDTVEGGVENPAGDVVAAQRLLMLPVRTYAIRLSKRHSTVVPPIPRDTFASTFSERQSRFVPGDKG